MKPKGLRIKRKPDNLSCTPPSRRTKSSKLADIVREYLGYSQSLSSRELDPFKTYPFLTALRKAALALTPDGKRFHHQRRLTRKALRTAHAHLHKIAPKLRRARTFDQLHTLIKRHTQIPGIGELYHYDTALRLAAHLRLRPLPVHHLEDLLCIYKSHLRPPRKASPAVARTTWQRFGLK